MKIYDLAIVGAGAAGLMAALQAGRNGLNVLLLDSKEKIGAKILMSGGTRCNVTNHDVSESDYFTGGAMTVRNVLRAFPPSRTIEFFRSLNVHLVQEAGGKYFPETHSAKTVLDALLSEIEKQPIALERGRKVTGACKKQNFFVLNGSGFEYSARRLVLASGGRSYPTTGSDGSGYALAQSFGHKIVPISAALTPLLTEDSDFKKLAGISVRCRITAFEEKQNAASFEDGLLFTHFGFSGPAALNISRVWDRASDDREVRIHFLPSENAETLNQALLKLTTEHPKQLVATWLGQMFPDRLAEVLLEKAGLERGQVFAQLRSEERRALIQTLTSFCLPVHSVFGFGKAEVTAGGVDFSEVHSKTLESLICPGLFFAGEILDVDGIIGGFNFQWAWSSGYVAAQASTGSLRARY